jgi:hypothetical protein
MEEPAADPRRRPHAGPGFGAQAMNPRDLIDRAARLRTASAMLLACAFVLSILTAPHPARAEVQSVVVGPTILTACDSITVRVEGTIETTCRSFTMATISGPVPIPELAGPVPAYRYTVTVTVDQLDPAYGDGCEPANTPYAKEFRVGSLPPGQHFVTAIERVRDRVTFAPLPDTSTASTSFTVAPSDSCWTSCTLLSFGSVDRLPEEPRCTAHAQPGGEGCFEVRLMNSEPVAGAQLEIRIVHITPSPAPSFVAKSVRPTGRADSLEVLWERDGNGVKVILFSASGKTIAPGQGPILRLCYDVGATSPRGAYYITFQKTLVANADGDELPQCPQFRMPSSLFCVGLGSSTCDLDGDGASNVRDIIRLARCALAGDACPDTIAARADCDGDGGVDVRDVICCARTLLARGAWSDSWTGENRPTVLGFTGAPAWQSETSGRVPVEVRPGHAFGGVQFSVIPPPGIRIAGIDLDPNEASYQLVWHRGQTGRIFAMLYRISGSEPAASPVPISVRFEPESWARAATSWGTFRVVTPLASTWEGGRGSSEIQNGEAALQAATPAALRISRARPNPFAASSEIEFAIGAASKVSVRVYDVAGRLVRSVLDASMPGGVHRVSWDGRDARGGSVPAGLYFIRVESERDEKTARIIKLR